MNEKDVQVACQSQRCGACDLFVIDIGHTCMCMNDCVSHMYIHVNAIAYVYDLLILSTKCRLVDIHVELCIFISLHHYVDCVCTTSCTWSVSYQTV